MADPLHARGLLLGSHTEPWVNFIFNAMPESYWSVLDETDLDRHLTLLRNLSDTRTAVVAATPRPGPGNWRIEVVGFDAFQFLSTLGMLLTIHGLSIQEAWVFTSQQDATGPSTATPTPRRIAPAQRPRYRIGGAAQEPGPSKAPDRRRKLIDVFHVRMIEPDASPPDWSAFGAELAALSALLHAARYDEVFQRLLGRFVAVLQAHRGDRPELEPIELAISNDPNEQATLVRIEARDSLGFLSLTASALSLCGIRIVRAEIVTPNDGRALDSFWVTDRSGRKIESDVRLRELRLSLILIEHFSGRLPHAVNPESALIHFSRFATDVMARPDWAVEFDALDRPRVLDALVRVLGESEFLWEDYLRDQPSLILPIINDPSQWEIEPDQDRLEGELQRVLAASDDSKERRQTIRRVKDREIFRCGLRAILGPSRARAGFTNELTQVAEAVIRAAYHEACREAADLRPRLPGGQEPPCVVCALGKFGGRELGFGSDLEVMIVFDDRALTADTPNAFPSDYFDQIVRNLRAVLGIKVGGTFELDFRLRPYGKGGPPATSWTSFQAYYQSGGPAWGYERQALIKLRVVGGDLEFGREVEAHRERFVFGPEPFDLDAHERLREMQIRQLVKPGAVNAKYSPGALVDVEYVVQALQLTFGGGDPSLRSPNTQNALAALGKAGRLRSPDCQALRDAHEFFMSLIDALRIVHGHAKDLTLPAWDTQEYRLLARRMRRGDPEQLRDELMVHLQNTRRVADRLPELLAIAPRG